MNSSMKLRSACAAVAIAGVVAAALLASGITPASALSALTDRDESGGVQIDATAPDGRTLGRVTPGIGEGTIDASKIPDLMAIQGDSGAQGYVAQSDLFSQPEPKSPAEAVEMMKNLKPRKVPVYAIDGKTVIDYVTLDAGTPRTAEKE